MMMFYIAMCSEIYVFENKPSTILEEYALFMYNGDNFNIPIQVNILFQSANLEGIVAM